MWKILLYNKKLLGHKLGLPGLQFYKMKQKVILIEA